MSNFLVFSFLALLFIGFVAVMANVTAWAYNMVVFQLFGGPGPIDGWVGLAINVLLGLIFGRNSVVIDKSK